MAKKEKVYSATAMICPKHGATHRAAFKPGERWTLICGRDGCDLVLEGTGTGLLRPGRFFLDCLIEEPVEGFTTEENWNGWACPYFTKEQGEKIMAEFNKHPDYSGEPAPFPAHYDEKRDAFITYSGYAEDPEEVWKGEAFDQLDGATLYPIGSGCWTWMEEEKA